MVLVWSASGVMVPSYGQKNVEMVLGAFEADLDFLESVLSALEVVLGVLEVDMVVLEVVLLILKVVLGVLEVVVGVLEVSSSGSVPILTDVLFPSHFNNCPVLWGLPKEHRNI